MNSLFKSVLPGLAIIGSIAFLLSCNQDETPFGAQDRTAFQSSVTGRVTDRAGRALGSAMITALPGGATTVSAPDGSFTLSGLASGHYRIAVAKDDYRDTMWLDSVRLGISAAKNLGALGMRFRYATIKGVVEDTAGGDPVGAGIAVEDQTPTAMAQPGGKFLLGRIEPGRVRLFSAIPGVGYGTLDTLLHADDTLSGVKLRINRRGGTVTGQVVGEDGKGVSGATVTAVGGALRATTSANGTFKITEVPSEGKVAMEISSGDLSTMVTGVRVGEGSKTSLDTIRIAAPTAPRGEVSVRAGLAFGFTTDSDITLVADTVSSDTSFHVARYLWNLEGAAIWDTTTVNARVVDLKTVKWVEGVHTVRVKIESTNGRVTRPATLTVRLVPPIDTVRVSPPGGTTDTLKVPGLVAYWPLNGNAKDSSGNGNDGSLQNTLPATDRFGNSSGALSFNGNDALVNIGTKNDLTFGTNDFTISMWFNTTQHGAGTTESGSGILAYKGSWGSETGVSLFVRGNEFGSVGGHLAAEVADGVSSGGVAIESPEGAGLRKVDDGIWHHVAFVVSRGKTASIFIDGSLYLSTSVAKEVGSFANQIPLSFGGKADHSRSLNGLLDDIRIFGSALDTVEIQALYHENGWPLAKPGQDSASLEVPLPRYNTDTLWPLDTIRPISTGKLQFKIDTGKWTDYSAATGIVLTQAGSLTVQANDSGKAPRTWSKKFAFTTWNPNVKYGSVKDAAGQTYRTVKIGTQNRNWMAENLNYKVDSSWWYDNSADSGAKYGRLYKWAALMKLPDSCNNVSCASLVQPVQQGICPSGWHVPSEEDWGSVMGAVGGANVAGRFLKSSEGWYNNGNGADGVGFRALPAGNRDDANGTFLTAASFGGWWTATESSGTDAWDHGVGSDSAKLGVGKNNKHYGFAARCVEDSSLQDTSASLLGLKVDSGKFGKLSDTAFVDTISSTLQTLRLSATKSSPNATITYNDKSDTAVIIAATDSVINVKVSNGGNSHSYTIRLVRTVPVVAIASDFGIPWNKGIPYDSILYAGQSYKTVKIGTQRWMAENLNFKGIDKDSGWWYNNKPDSGAKYGRLYTWATIMGLDDSCNTKACASQVQAMRQGICPKGWHVPTDSEWTLMQRVVDSSNTTDGTKLKSIAGWYTGNGTDTCGFRALAAGGLYSIGSSISDLGYRGYWWSSTERAATKASSRIMFNNGAYVFRYDYDKTYGYSLRCLEGIAVLDTSAALTNLAVDSGKFWKLLDTAFVDTISSTLQTLHLSATKSSPNATITYNDNSDSAVKIASTDSVINVKVSNNGNSRVYTIRLFRTAPVVATPSDSGIPWNGKVQYDSISYAGQTYKTVKIGAQRWMAENLNVNADSSWWFKNSPDSGKKYGRFYTWTALMALPDSCNSAACASLIKPVQQGICPSGWHVPNSNEWSVLISAAGSDATAGAILKSAKGWPNGTGADDLGFRALPAGGGAKTDEQYVGRLGVWWTATPTPTNATAAVSRALTDPAMSIGNEVGKRYRYSARCVEGGDVVNHDTVGVVPTFATLSSYPTVALNSSATAALYGITSVTNASSTAKALVPVGGYARLEASVISSDGSLAWTANVLMTHLLDKDGGLYDLRKLKSISFDFRNSDAITDYFVVALASDAYSSSEIMAGTIYGAEIKDLASLRADTAWKTVTLDISKFIPPSWWAPVPADYHTIATVLKQVRGIQFIPRTSYTGSGTSNGLPCSPCTSPTMKHQTLDLRNITLHMSP